MTTNNFATLKVYSRITKTN